jgi:hypothetical protein
MQVFPIDDGWDKSPPSDGFTIGHQKHRLSARAHGKRSILQETSRNQTGLNQFCLGNHPSVVETGRFRQNAGSNGKTSSEKGFFCG